MVSSPALTVIVGPISITKTDRDGRTTEQIQADLQRHLADLAAATISQSDYTAWTTYQYSKTRLVFDAGVRRHSHLRHRHVGRQLRPDHLRLRDLRQPPRRAGRTRPSRRTARSPAWCSTPAATWSSTWIGTDDTGATDTDPTGGSAQGNNMVKVSSSVFDTDGNLTESHAWFGSGANDYYATLYQYDWRDRLTDVLEARRTW